MDTGRGVKLDLVLTQGKTFSKVLRLGGKPFIYKAITGITQAAPVRVTAVGHGMVDGWSAAVVSVAGMTEINAENTPPAASDYRPVTVIDSDHVEFNDINSSEFTAYASGGYLQFYTPTVLTGAIARLTMRDKVGGTALVTLSSAGTGATVNNTTKKVTFTIAATTTAAITWDKAVYDAEIEFSDGTVKPLLYGNVRVSKEVTT